MKQKRTTETHSLGISDKIAISYGTINKKNPQVVYITAGCWIYTNTLGNHKKYLISLEETIRKSIKAHMLYDGLFAQRYLLDYDISIDNVFRSKRFLSIEVFLKQNSTIIQSIKELLPTVSERTSNFIDELIGNLEDNGFTVTKTKK